MYMCLRHIDQIQTVYTCTSDGFGAWDSRNCRVLRETAEEVDCGCDHLTHFAILLVSDTTVQTC